MPRISLRLPRISSVAVIALTMFTVSYWLLARYVQGIDLVAAPPLWWIQFVRNFPLLDSISPLVLFVAGLFAPSVLVHFVPVIAAIWTAHLIITGLLKILYDLPDSATAFRLFSRLRSNSGPTVTLNRLEFARQQQDDPLLRVGGPGYILVAAGDIVVTERNGRFERVLGSGKHKLERFETAHAVLDLREQVRFAEKVALTTREGLTLHTSLHVTFRLRRRDQRPGRLHQFTWDEAAVRRAARAVTVTDLEVQRWDDIPLGVAIGQLRNQISELHMDALIDPDHVFQEEPVARVQRLVKAKTRQIVRDLAGVELIELQIGALQFDEKVQKALTNWWETFGEKSSLLEENPQRAPDAETMARKRARETMIRHLGEALAYLHNKDKVTNTAPFAPALPSPQFHGVLSALLPVLQQVAGGLNMGELLSGMPLEGETVADETLVGLVEQIQQQIGRSATNESQEPGAQP
jgi:hypothetical protein